MSAEFESIDVATAEAMWRSGDLVVDVRLAEEYESGHIAGAVHVPLDRIPFLLPTLPPGHVIAVCSMGNRSRRAAETFARLGRTSFSLLGGTKAWEAAGLPIERSPSPGPRVRESWWRRLFG